MLHARILTPATATDLHLAFARLSLPQSAREYLAEKLPALHVLLTGLQRENALFLKAQAEAQDTPGREDYPSFVAGDQKKKPGTALLTGRLEQLSNLLRAAKETEGQSELARALDRALRTLTPPAPLTLGAKTLTFGQDLWLMGIVNVTPDSFSDGGRFLGAEAAVAQGVSLFEAGATVLDIGGESTRPGAEPVPPEEELARILPVIRGLREKVPDAILSVDTRKSEVAESALAAGAVMVNDVSGLTWDPKLAGVAARHGAAVCVMHIQGTPETMQKDPRYDDAVVEILEFLEAAADRAVAGGVPRERVLVDPGIGFGKTFAHNHFLLRRLPDLRALGLPVLVGPSRKAFLGALAGGRTAPERAGATAACCAAITVLGGADLLRVHDVAEVKEAVTVARALATALDGGALFSS